MKAHDVVFDTLQRRLDEVRFPASREEILRQVGDEKVTEEPEIRLREFLETIPEKNYGDGGEIADILNDSWSNSPKAP